MTTYQETIRAFKTILSKINTHLYTLNHEERLQAWGITDDNFLPTLVCKIGIGNANNSTLYLDIDPTGPNYLTVKDFDLTVRHIVNGGDGIPDSKRLITAGGFRRGEFVITGGLQHNFKSSLLTELEEIYQSILTRTPEKTCASSKILSYWETLRARLNEAVYCHQLDGIVIPEDYDVIPGVKNTIILPVGEHFKIILEYQHDSKGAVFTSCKVDFRDFNTGLTLADGYLLAVEPMLKFITLVESQTK